MSLLTMLLIAVGLAMDAFAVALSAGAGGQTRAPRAIFRLAFHFGLFQFLMPVIGWYLGLGLAGWFAKFDHWIAFGLLAFVGVRMVRSGLAHESEPRLQNPSKGWTMVMLSLATSIDALAIGFSLAMLKVDIWAPSLVIGVVTGLLSWLGVLLGNQLGERLGRRMEMAGGLVLIAMGLRIALEHLLA